LSRSFRIEGAAPSKSHDCLSRAEGSVEVLGRVWKFMACSRALLAAERMDAGRDYRVRNFTYGPRPCR